MFVILKKHYSASSERQTFCVIFDEYGNGVIGKYSLNNDTLTMRHDYEIAVSDSIVKMIKIDVQDTVPEFYPRRFIVRKDSLIDITNYKKFPEYPDMFARKREKYILVK